MIRPIEAGEAISIPDSKEQGTKPFELWISKNLRDPGFPYPGRLFFRSEPQYVIISIGDSIGDSVSIL
jgi:hypothetical protein